MKLHEAGAEIAIRECGTVKGGFVDFDRDFVSAPVQNISGVQTIQRPDIDDIHF